MSFALDLIEKMQALGIVYEEATSPEPREIGQDLLDQSLHIYATLGPEEAREFEDYAQFLSRQRGGFGGETEEVLHKLSPYQLQLIVQKFQPNMF